MQVSIRYIAVLGFQHTQYNLVDKLSQVSIRYIAVLGFQQPKRRGSECRCYVSIRYIAVLGFQQIMEEIPQTTEVYSFNPLYRGTWFPTLPQKRPL